MRQRLGTILNRHRVLRGHGVLGINRRNLEFIARSNPRRLFPRVDDKLLTKDICRARGIPVPDTFAVISRNGDIRRLPQWIAARESFVIKPARGSGGRGILQVEAHDGARFRITGRGTLTLEELAYHLSTLLAGLYSLGGLPDRGLVEHRIKPHPELARVCGIGTPDVRILLHRTAPVMAMLRLPTRASRGRGNLHQGAVGAGIDLETGETNGGVWRDRATAVHPDTGCRIRGLRVPGWAALLEAAGVLSRALGLGYVGVDFAVDAQLGPLVLEANARPGLAIQIANRRGLLPILEAR
ncbi:MAG: alpha-L-glutamate ligase-like protein [Kiritimatiellae bacterium]|nr:alpha-L-glutamate ligase-like protein [Kiritimatiellia bacterium]